MTNRKNRRRRDQRAKKKLLFAKPIVLAAVFLIASAIAAVTMAYAKHSSMDGSSVVATIDGEPVTYAEFQQSMAAKRAEVAAYYQSKYQASMSESFWITRFNGETPLDRLKDRALQNVLQIKATQMLAKRKGIVQDISYDTFLRSLFAENKRREKASENHEVIFGPVQYGESEYYDLVNSNLGGELRKLYQNDSAVSDAQLREYYDSHKESYKRQDTVRVVKVSSADADAATILGKIRTDIENGLSAESASGSYKEQVKIENQVFNAASAHSDSLAYPAAYLKAQDIKHGQITDVFQDNGVSLFLMCVDRQDAGYLAFGDVKEAIREELAGKAYDQAVEALIQQAHVVINRPIYDRINAPG